MINGFLACYMKQAEILADGLFCNLDIIKSGLYLEGCL